MPRVGSDLPASMDGALERTEGWRDFSSSVLKTPLSMFALLFASYSRSISRSLPFLMRRTLSLIE